MGRRHRKGLGAPYESHQSSGHQSSVGRRRRLVCDRRCLSASLRSRAARLGLVGRRAGGGGAVASASSADKRDAAASLLRSCERYSEAVTVITPSTSLPSSARIARSFSSSGKTSDEARSYESSTRLSVVFTDWPPGPGDLENRHDSSSAGIITPRTLTSRLVTARRSIQGTAARHVLGSRHIGAPPGGLARPPRMPDGIHDGCPAGRPRIVPSRHLAYHASQREKHLA
jgi:hypothetical protein